MHYFYTISLFLCCMCDVFVSLVAVQRLSLTCQCDLCAEVSEGLSCSTDAGLYITPPPSLRLI